MKDVVVPMVAPGKSVLLSRAEWHKIGRTIPRNPFLTKENVPEDVFFRATKTDGRSHMPRNSRERRKRRRASLATPVVRKWSY